MPGDENNSGVQQAGGEVPNPTLQAIGNLQTAYNANGGPPAERGNGRGGAEHERRVQNRGSRRASGQNPQDLPAPPPNPAQNDPPVVDLALKEGKFFVLDSLEPLGIEGEDRYVPNQNEILFTKSKWSFDGQDSFEDYVVRIGGYTRTLGVGEICFKNTLFQSFRPPCSFIVSDMEPSMSIYRKMSRKENPPLLVTSFILNLKRGRKKQGKYMTFIFVITGKLEFSKNSVNPVLEDYTMKS